MMPMVYRSHRPPQTYFYQKDTKLAGGFSWTSMVMWMGESLSEQFWENTNLQLISWWGKLWDLGRIMSLPFLEMFHHKNTIQRPWESPGELDTRDVQRSEKSSSENGATPWSLESGFQDPILRSGMMTRVALRWRNGHPHLVGALSLLIIAQKSTRWRATFKD